MVAPLRPDILPPFSRIPAEIRIKIFRLLLQNSGFIGILSLKDDQNLTLKSFAADNLVVAPFARDGPYDIHPAILGCCRLFHMEGRPILYPGDCTVIERMKLFPRWGPDLSGHHSLGALPPPHR